MAFSWTAAIKDLGKQSRHLRGRQFALLSLLGFVLSGLLIYGPALGSSIFIYGKDTVGHDYLMHLYGWKQSILVRGELPLWCPYLFCGLPFIASAALCPFYPTQWLYALLPFNTSFTLQYALAVAVGGLGFAWWMRQLRVSRTIAIFGGLAFVVSGHFITLTYAGHLQKMIAIAWSPIALGATARLLRDSAEPRRNPRFVKSAVVLCLAWTMQLLASHPQIFYATLAICALHLLGFVALRVPAGQSKSSGWWAGLAMLSALVLCLLLSAAQLFPTSEMHRVSNRAHGVQYAEAVDTSYPPGELLEYAIPSMFSDSVRGSLIPYSGKWGERIVSDFVGMPVLVLALIALFGSVRKYRWYLLALLLLSLLVGLGRYTPLYLLFYKLLPGFHDFRSPGTFMFVADLSLVALACFGIETLSEQMYRLRLTGWFSSLRRQATANESSTATWAGSNASTAICAGVLLICAIMALIGIDQASGTKLDIATAWEKQSYQFYRNLWIFGLEAGAVAALLLALRWAPKLALPLLAVLALLLPAIHNRHFIQFDRLAPYLDYVQNQPTFASLANAPQPVRVLEDNGLKSDQMLSNVGTTSGYHPVVLDSYDWAAQNLGLDSELFTGTFAVNYARTLSTRVQAEGTWENVGKFRKSGRLEYLWRRSPGALYFPNTRVIACDGGRTGERINYSTWVKQQRASAASSPEGDHTNDSAKHVPLDACFLSRQTIQRLRLGEGPQQARGWVNSWSPNHIQLRLASSVQGGRSLLRLAELSAPGWQAHTVQGNVTIPVVEANGSQRALAVPYGEGVVNMSYAPFSMRLGLFCSLGMLTLGISAAFGTLSRRLRRIAKWKKRLRLDAATAAAPQTAPAGA